MEISPAVQLTMMLWAFVWGVLLGLLWELLTVSRILLGVYTPPDRMRARYDRPLPLLHRPVPFEKKGVRALWRRVATGIGDVLFCLSAAVCVILLLYRYNSGAFRLSVPLLTLTGLGVFRATVARMLARPTAYLAYAAGAARCYLGALTALLVRPLLMLTGAICRFVARRRAKHREKRKGRVQNVKKKSRGGQISPAMGHRHSGSCHICRGRGHRRLSSDGVESAPQAGRGAGTTGKRAERPYR